ncbi:MAG: hypothetical protein AAFR54_22425, partial [Planctomycetota bacterium]
KRLLLALLLAASSAGLSSCKNDTLYLRPYRSSTTALDVYNQRYARNAPLTDADFQAKVMAGDLQALGAEAFVRQLESGEKELFGTKFGVGPAVLFNVDRVSKAEVQGSGENARVVSTDRNGDEVTLLLEFHHFFELMVENAPVKGIGVGPFAAVTLGTGDTSIGGLGLGLMVGAKLTDAASFNLGYGRMILNDVQRLPDGFVEGEAPPAGITSVTPVESDETVNFLLVSFRWTL